MPTSPEVGHVLDDPVGTSLGGRHAHLARRVGRASAYAEGVATFTTIPVGAGERDWADLATILGPGGFADLFSAEVEPPASWEPVFGFPGLQLLAPKAPPALTTPDAQVVRLGPDDVPDMLDLVGRTRPGPMGPRTIEMGTYVGVRDTDGDRLLAMAGTRMQPPGWSEISAVCTDPSARGRGLAGLLIGHLQRLVEARGERAFLHVVASNTAAHQLYLRLGFTVRREVWFHGYRVPGTQDGVVRPGTIE